MNRMMQWFHYNHLPAHLQPVSAHCCELARTLDSLLPEGPEKTAGLRKLLEAKDCFVRAVMEAEPAPATDSSDDSWRRFLAADPGRGDAAPP